ncbi:MAG TPA: hypothetical protein VLI04_14840 [Nocardioidaceae bacterium]|nr:hypothetical protein [Nocardioidaceae bacterium]
MGAYWLGVATLPVLMLAFLLLVSVGQWLHWWREDPGKRLGRGFTHEFDSREDGQWYPHTQHTHYWPPGTPWWLIRKCEPLRCRICLRDPHHKPAGTA